MTQFKWYVLDADSRESTFDEIKKSKLKIRKINLGEILVYYEYSGSFEYRNIVNEMSKYSVSQNIITTNKFYKILQKFARENKIILRSINLIDALNSESELINRYLKTINSTKNKDVNIEKLMKELRWLNNEGIDIKSIELSIKKSRIISFEIYSNAIVTIDSDEDEVIDEVINFMNLVE